MKKRLFLLFLLVSLALVSSALAFHEHVDIDGASTLISGYKAPTETEDGYSGDEVCSVCGAVVKKGSSIPAVGKQRKKAEEENITPQPPVRTQAPENPVTPVPTAIPTKEPTPPPPKSTATPLPADDSAEATKKPTSKPTPQPDLSDVPANTSFSGNTGNSGGGTGSGASAGKRSSRSGGKASATVAPEGVRDLSLYPIFSSRFPWRRLMMQPEEGIVLPLAGELVWPLEQTPSSPLMMLQIPGN